MRNLIDLHLYSQKLDVTQAEHGRTNIITVHECSVSKVLEQFTIEELMKAADNKRKAERDFVIDTPLPTHSFQLKDEDK